MPAPIDAISQVILAAATVAVALLCLLAF